MYISQLVLEAPWTDEIEACFVGFIWGFPAVAFHFNGHDYVKRLIRSV